MPIATQHPDYIQWAPDWEKCRDAYDGQRAVKAKGAKYLPKLTAQTTQEYDAYKDRALFYSITSKSVGSLVGMALARQPVVKYPAVMAEYFIENSGVQFYEAVGTAISEILLVGRYGILVDRQVNGGKPQIHGYRTENIINWKTNRDGKAFLIVLIENTYDPVGGDEFDYVGRTQYRVLRLVPRNQLASHPQMGNLLSDMASLPIVNEIGSDWIYTVSIYDHNEQFVSMTIPSNTGRPMNTIPFYVGTPFGIGFGTTKPPMLDIADINISHYRTSADLEHGRHFTGLPTAVVSGVDVNTKLRIGSMEAWVLPDKDAKAQYLEFTGQGLTSLENAMKEKQTQLATLSSRILDNSANGSEASDAIRLRYMSESASLSSITRSGEALMNLAYKTIAAMEGENPNDVLITMEKEFHNTRMSASDALKLTESYLTGGISIETYVFNMRRGDMLPVDRTDAQEIEELTRVKAAIDVANAAKVAKPPINQPPAQ